MAESNYFDEPSNTEQRLTIYSDNDFNKRTVIKKIRIQMIKELQCSKD
jgi:hypothetical protein